MHLAILLEKKVNTLEEAITLTNFIKTKLSQHPDVKISSNASQQVEPPEA